MRKLLIAVIILVGLLVAADRVGAVVASHEIASQVQTAYNLPSKPSVTVRGFPFLTQVASFCRPGHRPAAAPGGQIRQRRPGRGTGQRVRGGRGLHQPDVIRVTLILARNAQARRVPAAPVKIAGVS
jgi:DUF2993 family protein